MSEHEVEEAALVNAEEVVLTVKSGLNEECEHKLPYGAPLLRVVEVVARNRGLLAEEFIITREGQVEELSLQLVIEPDYPHRRRHHVHHKSQVRVIVFYGAKEAEQDFKRHATVEEVLTWAVAVKQFDIDASMAPEFELTLQGLKEELSGAEHIGHLAGHETALKLDLVRGDIANG